MMSVMEYAQDVNKTIEEILKACQELAIDAHDGDALLDELDITKLDNYVTSDIAEEMDIEEKPDVSKPKVYDKPKKVVPVASKEEIASKRKEMYKNKEKLQANAPVNDSKIVLYKEDMTVQAFAQELGVSASEIIKKLFMLGVVTNVNTVLPFENAAILALDYQKELKKEEAADVTNFEEFEIIDDEKDLVPRAPVVTIMGHVDHGKTTLLDTIRKTHVASSEAGGITQAISAYQVMYKGKPITFIDTPGHAAFTEMRARGAKMTDIVIIIVAADDGVMPQTIEAIDHAKAAKVPIIVAINKMDKPGANPDKIMADLAKLGLTPEEWGGDTLYNKIVATEGKAIDELLDNILLVAEMNNYRANNNRYASGTVVESRLDKHLGPVVTILIQNGTLRLGDPIVVGSAFGKIRTMRNSNGEEIMAGVPSLPVEITGLNEVPMAGDRFMAFETEKQARSVSEKRKLKMKQKNTNKVAINSLDDLFAQIQEGTKEINIIIKTDVNGSAEAVKNALEKIDVLGVKINVIRSTVGAITDSDIILAKASHAIIIGFNVRPSKSIKDYAKDNGVEIRLYDIIYKVVEEMEAAMQGMLDPEYVEQGLGEAEVRQLFKFSKVGTIAGCYVTSGIIKMSAQARVIRDSIVIYDGKIGSLQRAKDTVKEVKMGLECGITIEGYSDIKVGDTIEAYEMVQKK